MRLVWVTTKPPCPPLDGGRLVVKTTLEALSGRGHEIDLVAPYDPTGTDPREWNAQLSSLCRPHLVPVRPRPPVPAMLSSCWSRRPFSIERHRHSAVRAEVAALLRRGSVDVVHAEQLQALAQCLPASAAPVVLRCQNVESDLWRGWAGTQPRLRSAIRFEARRLAAFEGRVLERVSAAIALTALDAERLAALAGGRVVVEHVPAPFPAELPAGSPALPGHPAVVLLGSRAWPPNQDGTAWTLSEVWPSVHRRVPGAVLHVFGWSPTRALPPGAVLHDSPADSREAFADGAILLVPLRFGSGVRMKILESWARGLPVVATPEAVGGLDATRGRELLVAASAEEMASALRLLHTDHARRSELIAAGRAHLRRRHDPEAIAARLEVVYVRARDQARSTGSGTGRRVPPGSGVP